MHISYFPAPNPEERTRVLLWAKVDWLRVSVLFSVVEEMTFPAVELFYPEIVRPALVKLAEKMKEHHLLPEVYFKDRRKYFDVMVIFKLIQANADELDQILGNSLPPLIKKDIQRSAIEVLATGEAEINRKTVLEFMRLFKSLGFFRLSILEQGGERPLAAWETQLTELARGWSE